MEHPEGLILIDTGETARVTQSGYFPRWHPYFALGVREWVLAEEEVGPQLRALGISTDDVRWVVLTHLHTDHAGGLDHFPKSEIVVSRVELENASGTMGKLRGFLPQRWPSWFAPRPIELEHEPHGPFPESLRLTDAGDVTIVGTPGHTPGHVSVILDDGVRSVFFAGDASYTEALMVEGVVDGVSSDIEAARRSLERVRAYASERPVVYLPSHDPESGRRLGARRTVEIA